MIYKDTDINEFLRESNAIEGEFSDDAFVDARDAWNYAFNNRNKITLKVILEIHRRLMQRLNRRIAGRLRLCDVYVGGDCKRFISIQLLEAELQSVIDKLAIPRFIPEKEEAFTKITHIEFENVHPFEDGNGRTGRILYNIHRFNLGLPIHIIHEGKEQEEYYGWF